MNEHTTPAKLERYSFLWNEVRLVVAALSLIFGGSPIVLSISSSSSGLYSLVSSLLTVAWIISGITALYLLYRWNGAGKKVFGRSDTKDMIAFFVMIVSGLNLGIAGVIGTNIGMEVVPSGLLTIVMIIAGIAYLWSGFHLYHRWKAHGEKLF